MHLPAKFWAFATALAALPSACTAPKVVSPKTYGIIQAGGATAITPPYDAGHPSKSNGAGGAPAMDAGVEDGSDVVRDSGQRQAGDAAMSDAAKGDASPRDASADTGKID